MPGMRERTVKIGSAGKIFSLTGWKVGFVCAAPPLLRVARQGAPVPHLHHAAEPAGRGRLRARQGRRLLPSACARDLQRSRDRLTSGLRELGFPVLEVAGHLFPQRRPRRRSASTRTTSAFCRRLVHGPQGRRDPGLGVLRAGRRSPRWCASASPRRTRRSTPRWSGCRTRCADARGRQTMTNVKPLQALPWLLQSPRR